MGIKETFQQLTGRAPEKKRALDEALSGIEKQFGKGAVMVLGGAEPEPVESISTGSIGLDTALGTGGFPRGRLVEIYGPESSGKTTLAIHAIAQAQAAGGVAAFIDAEHAFDPTYARRLGVRLDELLVSQPDTGEQALEICETLVRSSAVDCIVIDSVAALVPKAEIEGEMGDSHVGLQARLMSQALRKLTGVVSQNRAAVIFINQIRMKIGVMFGSPETTTGGNALKFYASQRLDIRRIGAIKEGEKVMGNRTRVKVVKNKLAPPFAQVEFDIRYGGGVDRVGELLDLAVAHEVVSRSGAHFAYEGDRLGQGREKAAAALIEDPKRASAIEAKVREAMAKASSLDLMRPTHLALVPEAPAATEEAGAASATKAEAASAKSAEAASAKKPEPRGEKAEAPLKNGRGRKTA
jgi:recombination protein RecA